MKALKILLSLFFTITLATAAVAVTVTLQGGATGNYTLQSMTIDSNGNITITVNASTPPPPGALTLSLSPSTLPSGVVNSAYSQPVTMTASGGTSPYTYSCSGTGVSGLSASANGSTCTVSGTPTVAGTYTVTFTVTDSANAIASNSISFNISSGTIGGKYIDITTAGLLPNYLKGQSVAPDSGAYYGFTTNTSFNKITVNLEAEIDSTGDYTADMDLIVSTRSQPSCSDIVRGGSSKGTNGLWYGSLIGRSNETVTVTNRDASGRLQPIPPGTYYVTVCNFTPGVTGKFRLSWAGYY